MKIDSMSVDALKNSKNDLTITVNNVTFLLGTVGKNSPLGPIYQTNQFIYAGIPTGFDMNMTVGKDVSVIAICPPGTGFTSMAPTTNADGTHTFGIFFVNNYINNCSTHPIFFPPDSVTQINITNSAGTHSYIFNAFLPNGNFSDPRSFATIQQGTADKQLQGSVLFSFKASTANNVIPALEEVASAFVIAGLIYASYRGLKNRKEKHHDGHFEERPNGKYKYVRDAEEKQKGFLFAAAEGYGDFQKNTIGRALKPVTVLEVGIDSKVGMRRALTNTLRSTGSDIAHSIRSLGNDLKSAGAALRDGVRDDFAAKPCKVR